MLQSQHQKECDACRRLHMRRTVFAGRSCLAENSLDHHATRGLTQRHSTSDEVVSLKATSVKQLLNAGICEAVGYSSYGCSGLRCIDGVWLLGFLLQRDLSGTGKADELDQYEVRASRNLDNVTSWIGDNLADNEDVRLLNKWERRSRWKGKVYHSDWNEQVEVMRYNYRLEYIT